MNIPASRLPEFHEIPVAQPKKLLQIIILIIIISSHPTNSQSFSSSPADDLSDSPDTATNFQPSLAVVIGVLAIMFALTFMLLVYAKCCHRPSSLQYLNQENLGELPRPLSRVSGIDKTVIQSLPFFRFSTLKGWRNGLECSICLSKFEDIEILRLLPKCKHAFHIDCVDQWLEQHSGCPLCRCKVSEEDAMLFANSSSLRFLNSDRKREDSNLGLFIEREGSTRFGSQRSYGKMEHEMKDQEILEDEDTLHKFNHRIIISDYDYDRMMKSRWSNLNSSDLLFLKSEMITSLSNKVLNRHGDQETVAPMSNNTLDSYSTVKTDGNYRTDDHDHQVIKVKEELKRKREFEKKIKKFSNGESDMKSAKLVSQRSMSEIIVHPRFLGVESSNEVGNFGEISAKEERLKRLWLPIARRTVHWFANRDQQLQVNTKSQV
ncbi:E3 ubiquitin-protein ligase ATL42 [Lactuca sativa]|uniref:E3 ubiquitin-protein ligase ATL42 n=1 Tax=Lactuca sativa TaxID=4236 RepID=UPI000CB4FD53|nr:E3 ubiquitin-protein ligase ATL42 [Lactuca sativa]